MQTVNECIAFYDPGDDLTGQATAAITGRRFLKVSAAKQAGNLGLANDTFGGSIPVQHAGVGDPIFAVSDGDCANGAKLPIIRGHKVVPVEAGGAIAPGVRATSDATGRAIAYVAGANPGADPHRAGTVLNNVTTAGQIAIVALNI